MLVIWSSLNVSYNFSQEMRKTEHTLETFFIFYDSFVLPQVRWSYIIIIKNWMYELLTSCRKS